MHHIHHYQLCKLWCSSLSFCFGSIRKCGFVAPCHLGKLLHAEICQNTFFFFFWHKTALLGILPLMHFLWLVAHIKHALAQYSLES